MSPAADRLALVTGGSSGIGLATATLLAAEGTSVIVVGRDMAKLDDARRRIREQAADGVTVEGFSADLAVMAEIDALIAHLTQRFGHLDVLFANAGRADAPEFEEVDEATFDAIMNVNVKSIFFTVAKALPLMRAGGSIILTSSVAQDKGRPGGVLYSASKAAVRSMVRTLALDDAVLARGVRVNAVTPGSIATPLTARDDPRIREAIDEFVVSSTPLRRWGTAQEVARAVVFLAGDQSSYTTGAEILVDGGLAQT